MRTRTKLLGIAAVTALAIGGVSAAAIAGNNSDQNLGNASVSTSAPRPAPSLSPNTTANSENSAAPSSSSNSQNSANSTDIGMEEAQRIAETTAPGFSVVKSERDHEDGRLVWEVDMVSNQDPRNEVELDIDAATGEVIKNHAETDDSDHNDPNHNETDDPDHNDNESNHDDDHDD